jgi:serine/threonine protein kinase
MLDASEGRGTALTSCPHSLLLCCWLHPPTPLPQYLHTRAIIHRDIKPENILFADTGSCLKLADFGLAIDCREERAVTRAGASCAAGAHRKCPVPLSMDASCAKCCYVCRVYTAHTAEIPLLLPPPEPNTHATAAPLHSGTLDYMAPEVLRCPYKSKPEENKDKAHLHYSNTVDSWAVGVLVYELLVGCPPFYDKSKSNTEARIVSGVPSFPPTVSEAAKSFICAGAVE